MGSLPSFGRFGSTPSATPFECAARERQVGCTCRFHRQATVRGFDKFCLAPPSRAHSSQPLLARHRNNQRIQGAEVGDRPRSDQRHGAQAAGRRQEARSESACRGGHLYRRRSAPLDGISRNLVIQIDEGGSLPRHDSRRPRISTRRSRGADVASRTDGGVAQADRNQGLDASAGCRGTRRDAIARVRSRARQTRSSVSTCWSPLLPERGAQSSCDSLPERCACGTETVEAAATARESKIAANLILPSFRNLRLR